MQHQSWTRSGAVIVLVVRPHGRHKNCEEPRRRTQAASPMAASSGPSFESRDLYRLKSVGDVQLSPDGTRVAYSVQNSDRPGRPYSQVWIVDVATGTSKRLGSDKDGASGPRWSRDGQQIAYFGREDSGAGVFVSRADGSGAVMLAPVERHESSAAVQRRAARVVAGRQAGRVHLGDGRARNRGRQRRSDGHHALSLQADGIGRADALQRQPPAAHLHRRRRQQAGASS